MESRDFENYNSLTTKCSNFFRFQKKLMIFFMDRCSFSVRSEWRHLEGSNLQPEKVKRQLYGLLNFGDKKLHGGQRIRNLLQNPAHM